MKNIIFAIIIIMMILTACYTIDQARNENDQNFKEETLLTIWMVKEIYPVGECDPRTFQENCSGKNRQLCNDRGQWETVEICPTSCMKTPGQAIAICK